MRASWGYNSLQRTEGCVSATTHNILLEVVLKKTLVSMVVAAVMVLLYVPVSAQVNPEITVHEVSREGTGPTFTIVTAASWDTGGTGGWRGLNKSTHLFWYYEKLSGAKTPLYSIIANTGVEVGAAGGGLYSFQDTPSITCPANQEPPWEHKYWIRYRYVSYYTIFWDFPPGSAQDEQKSPWYSHYVP